MVWKDGKSTKKSIPMLWTIAISTIHIRITEPTHSLVSTVKNDGYGIDAKKIQTSIEMGQTLWTSTVQVSIHKPTHSLAIHSKGRRIWKVC